MKATPLFYFGAAVLSLTLGAVTEARAQATTVQTTTTQNLGTISEFSPDTIVIRSESAPEPVRYSYTSRTTYVDEDGNPVSMQTVRSGLPVTVHYSRVGDRLEANRVIVRRSVTTAPTTTVTTVPAAPVPVAPAPVVVEKRTTTTTTTRDKDKDKDKD